MQHEVETGKRENIMAQELTPRPALAAVDDMQLASYLVSRGLDITELKPKPGGRYVWAMFVNTDEYQRLRRAWPMSPEFLAFQVYNDLLSQVKS
jgi:hypothetical protein